MSYYMILILFKCFVAAFVMNFTIAEWATTDIHDPMYYDNSTMKFVLNKTFITAPMNIVYYGTVLMGLLLLIITPVM